MVTQQAPDTVEAARDRAALEVELVIAEMAALLREQVAARGLYSNEVIHGSLALARLLAARHGIPPAGLETTK
jgi:hypothetical protein